MRLRVVTKDDVLLQAAILIRLLILDVDGVLTAGDVYVTPESDAVRTFHVQDGYAIKRWHESGGVSAILSGRGSKVIETRARQLGVSWVDMGCDHKIDGFERICAAAGVPKQDICMVGDDLPDVGPMARSGFSIAVANARPQVKRVAAFVTRRRGGTGVVAEVVEHLLRLNGWS